MRASGYLPRIAPQEGAALMVMLVIIVIGVSAFFVSSLSRSGLQIARDQKTAVVLAQAKDALIGHAVTHTDYPLGNLPCPDTNNDGIADAGGSTECPSYIGRLPWKTLGLPDLRDASGERLWYTLSRNVRRYVSVRPINSDTPGTLNITGSYAASGVMAIVFAPGTNVGNQSRSETQTVACTTTGDIRKESLCAANFLEGSNANASPGASPNLNYQSSDASLPFNDQLEPVSREQLLQAVEKRVGGEIKKILNTYYSAWSAFPFAAPFSDPSASGFTGQASPATYGGLLPVGDNITPAWETAPAISISGGGSLPDCELRNGASVGSRWRCGDTNLHGFDLADPFSYISIPEGATITITGTLKNVGTGLWRPHNIANICEVRAKDSGGTTVLATSVLDNVTVTGTLNADGSATVKFQAKGKAGFPALQRIELRDIPDYNTDIKSYYSGSPTCPQPSTSPIIPAWLFNDPAEGNNWHQFAYYAVAPQYAPGGDHTCTTSPCLTLNGQDDKRAIVVMTGSALNGQTHPSSSPANYLEGGNLTPDDIYENKAHDSSFNDQVITVSQ